MGHNPGALAEMSVIGCILQDASRCTEAFEILLPEMFAISELGEIYKVSQTIAADGRPVDIAALQALLPPEVSQNIVVCEGVGAKLARATAYAEIIRENWRKNTTAKQLSDLVYHLTEPGTLMGQCLAEAERIIDAQRDIENKIESATAKELTACIVEWMGKMDKPPNSICTGYKDLDRLTGGFERGGLYVLAARPSHGKTDFALNLALRMSRQHRITYHSLELTREQCVQRLISNVAQVNEYRIRDRNLSDRDLEDIRRATEIICNNNLVIDERVAASAADIKSSILKTRPDLIIIDHMLLMDKQLKGNQKDHEGIARIVVMLKGLAKQYNIVILAIGQTLRETDKSDKPLTLSDIQGGGAIDQNADGACFVVSDKSEHPTPSGGEYWPTKMPWVKNRHGGLGTLRFCYHPQYHRFVAESQETALRTDDFVEIEDDGILPL